MNNLIRSLLVATCVLLCSQCTRHELTTSEYLGPYATINFDGAPEQFNNSKYLNRQVMAGPNFAFHYAIAYMSCGYECRDNLVVNSVNGDIIKTFTSCGQPNFTIDSTSLTYNHRQHDGLCTNTKLKLVDNELVLID